jgi:hypothetical protein
MGRWDDQRFGVERECTCRRGDRSAECRRGWHLVDTESGRGAAIRSATDLACGAAASYRVVDVITDEVVLPPVKIKESLPAASAGDAITGTPGEVATPARNPTGATTTPTWVEWNSLGIKRGR